MTRVKFVGLCLAAVFVASALMSASASAATEPALYECVKAGKETVKYKKGTKEKSKSVYTGEYTEKECKTKAGPGKYRAEGKPEGKYALQEWTHAPKAFSGSGGPGNLDVVGLGEITCSASSLSGTLTSPTTGAGIRVKFTGCEVDGEKCKSSGAATGEIVTNALDGEVGYVDAAKTEVGIDSKGESSIYEAEFSCGIEDLVVKGSVIGLVSPVNTLTTTGEFTFERLGTTQLLTKFEGGLPDTLITEVCGGCNPIGSGEKESALQGKFTVTLPEKLEVRAS